MMGFQAAWGWPAALYLFLGGLGAGSFIAASALLLLRLEGREKAVAATYWLSFASLVGGLTALVFELGRPTRGLLLWRSFVNLSSWMAVGAWGLAISLVMFLAAALLSTEPISNALAWRWSGFANVRERLRDVLAAAGSAFALFVALYTGLLLKGATGVPFWNAQLLPALFAVSALAAGANATALMSVLTGCAREVPRSARMRVAAIMACLAALEGILLLAYLANALNGGGGLNVAESAACALSARALVSGPYAAEFWILVVATGLAASVALCAASCLLGGRAGSIVLAVGAGCALSGECALRFLVLLAGTRVDYLAATLVGAL